MATRNRTKFDPFGIMEQKEEQPKRERKKPELYAFQVEFPKSRAVYVAKSASSLKKYLDENVNKRVESVSRIAGIKKGNQFHVEFMQIC